MLLGHLVSRIHIEMNRNELLGLLNDWMHSKPECRGKLEAAIEDQEKKAKDSLWSGYQEDEMGAWLRKCLHDSPDDQVFRSGLEERIAQYVKNEQPTGDFGVEYEQPLERAEYHIPSYSQHSYAESSEGYIRKYVRGILREVDSRID